MFQLYTWLMIKYDVTKNKFWMLLFLFCLGGSVVK